MNDFSPKTIKPADDLIEAVFGGLEGQIPSASVGDELAAEGHFVA